jgi:hypothetical protein
MLPLQGPSFSSNQHNHNIDISCNTICYSHSKPNIHGKKKVGVFNNVLDPFDHA